MGKKRKIISKHKITDDQMLIAEIQGEGSVSRNVKIQKVRQETLTDDEKQLQSNEHVKHVRKEDIILAESKKKKGKVTKERKNQEEPGINDIMIKSGSPPNELLTKKLKKQNENQKLQRKGHIMEHVPNLSQMVESCPKIIKKNNVINNYDNTFLEKSMIQSNLESKSKKSSKIYQSGATSGITNRTIKKKKKKNNLQDSEAMSKGEDNGIKEKKDMVIQEVSSTYCVEEESLHTQSNTCLPKRQSKIKMNQHLHNNDYLKNTQDAFPETCSHPKKKSKKISTKLYKKNREVISTNPSDHDPNEKKIENRALKRCRDTSVTMKHSKKYLEEVEGTIKDEDIDEFCDQIDERDNEQYENWIKLIEAKLHPMK